MHKHTVCKFSFEERIPLCFKCLKTNDLDLKKNKDGINGEKNQEFFLGGVALNIGKDKEGRVFDFFLE